MNVLQGEIALVTGASRGIGNSVALALAREGATVVGTATSPSGAERITAALRDEGLDGRGEVLDVSDAASIDALVARLKESDLFPGILVNNAGITRDNLFMRMKDEEWEQVLDTNLTGAYRLTRACVRPMMKARRGRIINITSVVACTGNPGQANYVAAKAGMVGFTKALAREIGSRGVTVNAVAPGLIDTDMTRELPEEQRAALLTQIPVGRLGQGEDVAAAVVFLASPGAAYITGETIQVNGGMYMG